MFGEGAIAAGDTFIRNDIDKGFYNLLKLVQSNNDPLPSLDQQFWLNDLFIGVNQFTWLKGFVVAMHSAGLEFCKYDFITGLKLPQGSDAINVAQYKANEGLTYYTNRSIDHPFVPDQLNSSYGLMLFDNSSLGGGSWSAGQYHQQSISFSLSGGFSGRTGTGQSLPELDLITEPARVYMFSRSSNDVKIFRNGELNNSGVLSNYTSMVRFSFWGAYTVNGSQNTTRSCAQWVGEAVNDLDMVSFSALLKNYYSNITNPAP